MEAGMLTYSLRLADRYDGMVMATFPDVPEAMAVGRDYEEACHGARSALEAALESYVAEGRALPDAVTPGRLTVSTEKFGMFAAA
jgi:antitoxin HicB